MMRIMKAFFFLSILPFFLFAEINGPADYQYWQRGILKAKMSERVDFFLTGEARFGDNVSKFYYTYLQALFAFSPRKWISIAPGYRQIYKRYPLSTTHFDLEYSPMIDLTFKTTLKKWGFSNRNRLQFLVFKSDPSHWVYRNRIRFTSPWSFTSFNATPYIENEFFYRQAKGINQDRLSIGFQEKFTSHVSMDFFYIARFLKRDSGWVYNNIFGCNLVLKY